MTAPASTLPLPGDLSPDEAVRRMVRVNHAGEYGAKRIYEGQLAFLRPTSPLRAKIEHMAEQERVHLEAFEAELVQRRIRPTALFPIWHVAGFALGAATALMGDKAAMACTIAVEEVIDQHYAEQSERLGAAEAPLKQKIDQFRAEELEHRDTAVAEGGREAVAFPVLEAAIKTGSRLAIWLAQRV
ncbi:demethoxyubiquinone hydroxylase family protein [Elstera sp.]|jgi:ubiquinone biosynthesis monooxygenase Coq7|uniref:demethoxyubiquinone hydroxylase family protein n=1 Tax=Elstera sp. TaxID=1916664 RepID=UPI0037C07647